MRRPPTYIFNADTTTRRDVAQYLANAGILQTLNEIDYLDEQEERLWERHWRRNPEGELSEKDRKKAELVAKNRYLAKCRLLGEMFKQARGMGWDIPDSWDPVVDLHPRNIQKNRNEQLRTPDYDPFQDKKILPKTTPVAFVHTRREDGSEILDVGSIITLLQNQAIILKNIAPMARCIDEEGREFEFQYHIVQGRDGVLKWGLPGLYDDRMDKKGDPVRDYYLYDNREDKKKRSFGPRSPNFDPTRMKGDPPCQPYHSRVFDETLKKFAEAEERPWPIPFIPKKWENTEEDVHKLSEYEKERIDLLRKYFDNGFILFNTAAPIEVIATVEQPSLEDIDEAYNAIPPDEEKMPDGSEPPEPFDFQFGEEKPFEWQELALDRFWGKGALNDYEDLTEKEKDNYVESKDRWRGGLVEACTGAGKTIFCFKAIASVLKVEKAIAKKSKKSKALSGVRISIVVPTIVLLNQWYAEAAGYFNENKKWVPGWFKRNKIKIEGFSRHGGGYDELAKQISIWVINTAAEELPVADRQHPDLVRKIKDDGTRVGDLQNPIYPKHFLIVDEVHRSTAPSRRQIYNFAGSGGGGASSDFIFPEYRLGVTATLPKDEAKFKLLKRFVGQPLCRYRYADALNKGNISKFVLRYLETSLTDQERYTFDDLSIKIKKMSGIVKGNDKKRKKGEIVYWGIGENKRPLPSWKISEERLPTKGAKETDPLYDRLRRTRMIQKLKEERGDPADKSLLKFLGGVRARIYWSAANRLACALDLIRAKVLLEHKKVIVFHKSIDGAIALYNALYLGFNYGKEHPVESVRAGIYHSQNPPGVNEEFLKAFKKDPSEPGSVQCLVSVQSLLEGLDVPSAGVAVCVAADKSQIKALQSLGRVLRKDEKNPIKEYWFVCVNTPGAPKAGDPETDVTRLKGDEVVKFNFESSLKKGSGFVIDPPETLICNPSNDYPDNQGGPTRLLEGDYPHTPDDVIKLHNQCGLMSYDELHHLAVVKLGLMDNGIFTKSKIDEALEDYNEAVEQRAGGDLEIMKTEQIEISRPTTAWPDWLKAKFKSLPEYIDPLASDDDDDDDKEPPPSHRYYY